MTTEAEIGARIRELRLQAGMTAESLATAAGLSPTAFSRIENGGRVVKSGELARIASALGVSPLSILDRESLLGRLPVAARAIDGSDSVSNSSVVARLTALAELDEVLRAGGLPSASPSTPPTVDPADWLASARTLAAWVNAKRDRFDPQIKPAGPFEKLLFFIEAGLNIEVLVESHPQDKLLGAAITDRSFPLIFVNADQAPQRGLFTLAHELGHVLVGSTEPLTLDRDLTATDVTERFANAFAAELLMPNDEISQHVTLHGTEPDSLGLLLVNYGVSLQSLAYRLHNLGLVDWAGRDRLLSIGVHGLLSQMKDDLLRGLLLSARAASIPTHSPLGLTARAAEGWRKGVVSARPLAELLGTDPEHLIAEVEEADRGNVEFNPDARVDDVPREDRYAGSPI